MISTQTYKLPRATIFLFWFILVLSWPLISQAEDPVFDPEYIISDHELTDYQAMTLNEVQDFLEKAGGALANYSTRDIDGKEKLASEIIYRASQEYRINPQFLIALIQREKSLITKKSPTKDDYNWATGFTCYDYRRPVPKYRGLTLQIDRAAWRFRYYLEHPWQFQFKAGVETKTLVNWKDKWLVRKYGRFVTPKNAATANLYNYAPHVFDNWLFWKIWLKWFGFQDKKFPNGTLLRAEGENGVWLIQNEQRRPFHSKNVFLLNYNFKDVQIVNRQDLESYEFGKPMAFPNYSLVSSPNDEVFMLVNDKKRLISEKIFRAIGFHPEEIIEVEDSDLTPYQDGEPILSPYPSGALIQNNDSKAVYYVKENIKYPIVDAEILNVNFPYSHIIKVDPQELAEFKNGESIRFRDGTLIKTPVSPAVYVISQGKRLPVSSAETFEAVGYQWDSIIEVNELILNLHPLGKVIKVN